MLQVMALFKANLVLLGEDPASSNAVDPGRHGFRFDPIFLDFVDDPNGLSDRAVAEHRAVEVQALLTTCVLMGKSALHQEFVTMLSSKLKQAPPSPGEVKVDTKSSSSVSRSTSIKSLHMELAIARY